MNMRTKFAAVTAAGCLSALVAGAASAGEIIVVSSGGPLPDVMGTLVPMFEKATGNKVKISFKGGPAVAADVKQGAADLVITNTEVVDDLANAAACRRQDPLMISKVGIAVKAGAPKPDVSTPDKLKAALLAAKTVGYSQGASGQHFATVLDKLGIADAIKPKAVVVQGRPVGAAIASGEAELGFQQVAELRPVAGVDQFAELPPATTEADPLLRRHPRQGEGRGNRTCTGELPAVRAGAGGSQAEGHGRPVGHSDLCGDSGRPDPGLQRRVREQGSRHIARSAGSRPRPTPRLAGYAISQMREFYGTSRCQSPPERTCRARSISSGATPACAATARSSASLPAT